MAVVTSRTCDIDAGHDPADAYSFGFNGEYFSADLCPKDAAALEKAMEPYTKVAQAIEVRDLTRGGNGNGFSPAVVRAWANANGRQLGDRGRIPADIVAAWRSATGN